MTERINRKLVLIHSSGTELFPVQIENLTTGNIAFRVAPVGGRNALGLGIELTSIDDVIEHVLRRGYKVRARSLDGTVTGSFKIGGKAIVAHRLNTSDE